MCKPADTLGMCGWEPLSLHVCISEDCFTWYSRSVVGRESENVSQSVVSDSATPRTVAHQAPLSMGFSRQEYWSRLPCPPSGDLPKPGIEPASLISPVLAGGFFTTSTTWEAPPPPSCSRKQLFSSYPSPVLSVI